jgi:hypothetical protein
MIDRVAFTQNIFTKIGGKGLTGRLHCVTLEDWVYAFRSP